MAGFVGELILDNLSEAMNSAGDFRVLTSAPLARYPAEREAGDSMVSPCKAHPLLYVYNIHISAGCGSSMTRPRLRRIGRSIGSRLPTPRAYSRIRLRKQYEG